MNILLQGAGGPASHGVIKSLRKIEFKGKIVSVDANPLSVGFHLSDKSYVVPKAKDEDRYIDELYKIVNKENIDLILPTSGNDIIPISKNSHLFGGKLFMSDYEAIMDCSDKMRFYEKCKDKFPLPKTSKNWYDIGVPLFAKPNQAAGSRGATCCTTERQVLSIDYQAYGGDYIFQDNLPGQEYTIDVLCDMESNPLVVVPRKRLETKAGISSKGEIIKDEFIEKSCYDICKFLNLKGPICLQMKEDKFGKPKFIEINPRFGGGTFFATLAGVNFSEIILSLFRGRRKNDKRPKINEPKLIKVLRYYEEVVV